MTRSGTILVALMLSACSGRAVVSPPTPSPAADTVVADARVPPDGAAEPSADAARGAPGVDPGAARVTPDVVRRLLLDVESRGHSADEAFLDAFARADWDAFDPEADAELLRRGWFQLGSRALEAGDGPTAVRALSALAARSSGDHAYQLVRGLSAAYALTGDLAQAAAFLDPYLHHAESGVASWAWVYLGDVRLVDGDLPGAQEAWRGAQKVKKAPNEAGGTLRQAQQAAWNRLLWVGRALPRFEAPAGPANTWFGGAPISAESLQGRVAVVLPFDTLCGPCRVMSGALQRLHEQRAQDGLVVFALVTTQDEGRLPPAGASELFGGTELVRIAKDGMPAHVEAYRRNAGITYPVGLLPPLTWMRWAPGGWHPVLVVGRDGKVAYVTAGGDSIGFARVVIDRLLASK